MSLSTTLRTLARTIAIVCIAAILSALLLAALAVIFFTLRPPFSQPETGYLRTDVVRELRLTSASPVAVVDLHVRHDPRIFSESPSATFDPTRLRVAATLTGGAPAPVQVRIYPADETPVTDLTRADDGGWIRWLIDCEARTAGDCARRYLIVVSADRPDADLRINLAITADLPFPPHVPTPFLVAIGLDAQDVGKASTSAALHSDAASGAIRVSPEAPVTDQQLTVPPWPSSLLSRGGARVAGLTLELTATREGNGIPVGLLAPPPVRAAIVDGDGAVVVDVGVRPGQPATVTLPPIEGEHQLITWWQDRAAQAYRVNWRLELGSVAARAGPGIGVGEATQARSLDHRTNGGEARVALGGSPSDLAMGVGIDVGRVEHGRLPPGLGVLRLAVELDADATEPVILLLSPGEDGGGEEVPTTLRPGEPVALALDAAPRCDGGQCGLWQWRVKAPGWGGAADNRSVMLNWRADVELWPLDPLAEGPSFYEIDE